MPKQSIDKVFSSTNSIICGNLFISNLEAASSLQTLKSIILSYEEYHIKAIVTVAKNHKLSHSNDDLPDYLYIPALDTNTFDLITYFNQSNTFIQKCLSSTNVLVHCVAGISRSATLVIAYLMKIQEKPS